jgi:hypothetical protein
MTEVVFEVVVAVVVCARRVGALKKQATSAQEQQAASKNLRAGKNLSGGKNLSAVEYFAVCVFLISSRILSYELQRRTT